MSRKELFKGAAEMAADLRKIAFQPGAALGAAPAGPPPAPDPAMIAAAGGMPPAGSVPGGGQPQAPMDPAAAQAPADPAAGAAMPPELEGILSDVVQGMEQMGAAVAESNRKQEETEARLKSLQEERAREREQMIELKLRQEQMEQSILNPVGVA